MIGEVIDELSNGCLRPTLRSSNSGSRSSSRANHSSPNMVDYLDECDNNELEALDFDTEPTSAILLFCKEKFLVPYVYILGIAGLRPKTVEPPDCATYLGHFQTIVITFVLLVSYFLQFVCKFRRDQSRSDDSDELGLLYENRPDVVQNYGQLLNWGKIVFIHGIPAGLHFIGFSTAVYVFRIVDHEQLQRLIEKVFLLSKKPKTLVPCLWCYMACGLIFVVLSTVLLVGISKNQWDTITFEWFKYLDRNQLFIVRGVLIFSLFCHDTVQVLVIVSYCIHCFLLREYLLSLKEKLAENVMDSLDWMREMSEFQKQLHHLNSRSATPVCFFAIINLTYTMSGFVYLLQFLDLSTSATRLIGYNVGNIVMCTLLAVIPFYEAASLSMACRSVQWCGHHIRIRPFVHSNTTTDDLNSVLLFASSLRMSAKLFRIPIYMNYLCFIILCFALVTLTFGMCL